MEPIRIKTYDKTMGFLTVVAQMLFINKCLKVKQLLNLILLLSIHSVSSITLSTNFRSYLCWSVIYFLLFSGDIPEFPNGVRP